MTRDEIEQEIANLREALPQLTDTGDKIRAAQRITDLERLRDKPAHLKAGQYETTRAVPNPTGDGRKNRAHWRSPLEKSLPVPVGYRFTVGEGGLISDSCNGTLAWWLYEPRTLRDEDPAETARNALHRAFIADLMVASRPVIETPAEEHKRVFGHRMTAVDVFDAALRLGLTREALMGALRELYAEQEKAAEDNEDATASEANQR